MKRCFRENTLAALAVVSLILYHGTNFREGRFLDLREGWTTSRLLWRTPSTTHQVAVPSRGTSSLEVGLASQNVFQPKQLDVVRFVPVDPAAGWIAHSGYALRYLAGQIRNDILLGEKHPRQTFFWRDEIWLQYPSARTGLLQGLGAVLKRTVEALEQRGVTVVVLPIPAHLSVQRDKWKGPLPRRSPWNESAATETEDALTPYQALIQQAPRQMVNLLEAYRAYQEQQPGEDLYGTAESHWSSLGITVAASETLKLLKRRGWAIELSSPQRMGQKEARYDFDFMNHLILPPVLTRNLARFRWEEPLYRLKSASQPRPGRLIVAGTSCSARHQQSPYGFGPVLADALGLELVDFSKERYWMAGSFEKMRETGFKLRRGDLLVWEVPIKTVVSGETEIALPEMESFPAPQT